MNIRISIIYNANIGNQSKLVNAIYNAGSHLHMLVSVSAMCYYWLVLILLYIYLDNIYNVKLKSILLHKHAHALTGWIYWYQFALKGQNAGLDAKFEAK